MKLRFFVLGAVALLTLSSCNGGGSAAQTAGAAKTQTVVSQSAPASAAVDEQRAAVTIYDEEADYGDEEYEDVAEAGEEYASEEEPDAWTNSGDDPYSTPNQWANDAPAGQPTYPAQVNSQPPQFMSTEAMTAAHNERMAAIQNSSAAHSARMANLHSQFDAHNNAWATNQRVGDERHAQTVHAINGEYEYSNPSNGQRYWVPGELQNPVVINPDGSQTELQQYNPSSNY